MQFVQQPVIRPQRCALLPNIAASNEPSGFFDFNTDLDLEHVYVSFTAFMQMAAAAGFVHASSRSSEEARLRRELDAANDLAAAAVARAERAEAQVAAVEVLKAGGFTPARKPGRPKGSPKDKAAV